MTNPLNYPITSAYGIARTYYVGGVMYRDVHDGIDFAYPQGTPVTLPPSGSWDGTVTYAGTDQYGGAYVDVKAKDGGVSRFLHLSKIDVKKGDYVTSNQQLGLSGGAKGTWGAGLSTGAHLHLGLLVNNRAVDPKSLLEKAYKDTTIINPNINTMNESLIKHIQGSGGSALSKELLVNAIKNNDQEYFDLYYPAWIRELEEEAKQPLVSKIEDQNAIITQMSAKEVITERPVTAESFYATVAEHKEEIDARTAEINKQIDSGELIGLVTEAQELNKKQLSGSAWFMGWLTFGIDKWAIITTTLSTVLFYISQNVPQEYHQLLFIFGGVASLGVLFFFGANKLIDKWNKK